MCPSLPQETERTPQSEPGDARARSIRDQLAPLVGRTCIYEEKWLVVAVHVAALRTDERGVRFVLQPLVVQGLSDEPTLRRDPGAAWQVLTVTDHSVYGYGGWEIYFDPTLVEIVLRDAQVAARDHLDPAQVLQRAKHLRWPEKLGA